MLIRSPVTLHIGNGVPCIARQVEAFLVNPTQAGTVIGIVIDARGNFERAGSGVIFVAHIDVANALGHHRSYGRACRRRRLFVNGIVATGNGSLGIIGEVAAVEQWTLIYLRNFYGGSSHQRITLQRLLLVVRYDMVGQYRTVEETGVDNHGFILRVQRFTVL